MKIWKKVSQWWSYVEIKTLIILILMGIIFLYIGYQWGRMAGYDDCVAEVERSLRLLEDPEGGSVQNRRLFISRSLP